MFEFYDRTGHDIKDMLLACHYRGTECGAENFDVPSKTQRGVFLSANVLMGSVFLVLLMKKNAAEPGEQLSREH
ncbi:hypothetical protein ANANG_G00254840 [Anguilla anguilla]|uniref:Uncharacterized protein n=1 Tax=Anguilla anguilla TaxID=7936 RepID=A0A9D3LSX9_ANGAN|nr:hypothetical protein ANANG_G00254840 [Anguilla anguilla]